jgi:2OG-Fe(II) oxygenase superfamily.
MTRTSCSEQQQAESTPPPASPSACMLLELHPLKDIVNLDLYSPLFFFHDDDDDDATRTTKCCHHHYEKQQQQQQLLQHRHNNHSVAMTLPNFLLPHAIQRLVQESMTNLHKAFYTPKDHTHNVYLTPMDPTLGPTHAYNLQVTSTKGCIQTDQLPSDSILLTLYHNEDFKRFLQRLLGVEGLYPYQDPLSSINVHYASEGQELGWHFDNSSFAITLLLQEPEDGGVFEYVPHVRHSSKQEQEEVKVEEEDSQYGNKKAMEYEMVEKILGGDIVPETLDIKPGTLVLFRGKDSLHRVTKVIGNKTRILVVLAYNEKPGVALSEEARRTFFGRTGMEAEDAGK